MDDFRDQLFRYAQDLDDLLEQHGKLQQRYQSLLQQQGRSPNSNDQLLDLIIRSRQALVITDTRGRIARANRAAREFLQGTGSEVVTTDNLCNCVAAHDRDALVQLIDRFAVNVSSEAAVLCRFDQADPRCNGKVHPFAFLAVPVHSGGQSYIYWLMRPMPERAAAAPTPQFVLPMDSGTYGVMITDGQAKVTAANLAFSSISEYGPDELLGQSARLLSSGRHSTEFYQAFWARLTALGNWTGEFLNRRKSGHIYPEWKTVKAIHDIEGQLVNYVSVIRDISENDNSIEQLSRLAYFDALTGLPNRRMLEDRMSQAAKAARRGGDGMSVLFIDLDRFKPVNDLFGHDTGDLVLQEIGARLQGAVRATDTVARVGGDEFVVLLPESHTRAQIEAVIEKILATLDAPVVVGDHGHAIGASIGCAIYPEDGEDAETLIRHADAAMYRSKKRGGNQGSLHGDQVDLAPHRTLGSELWGAAERGEMRLVYQPQVDAGAGRGLRGCEALLRWTHPRHGAIGPETFIALAEENGAIVPLGQWVLATACAQMQHWNDAGLGGRSISVNISYRQLQEPGFADSVRDILLQTGLPPVALELELTESATSRLEAHHVRQLQGLRTQGVKVAIDDFGVGHSSLKRLLDLPADSLKIDRHFVRNLGTSSESRALSQCVVGVGLALGMQVIAEGVEHQDQADVLAKQGCNLLQGYLTGPPMEAAEMLAWMQRQMETA
ncbi:EAL domain-containing protein [Rubrivivax sp. A210]|uniref:putative bifunctional diguanylate cyclase/phosphodiesterase n=1 Tax=Rubrivivax sp. A210 TaxID=2772301 RepID=UPI001917C2CA|nr:EAL domain-containing protein [Rubrivivax sp. A210]CAD5373356.1 EAL domain-containing protein [Rubrivivax sp. A210]